jgi:hypothetical protein
VQVYKGLKRRLGKVNKPMRVLFLSRAYLKIGNKTPSVKGKNKKYKINNIIKLATEDTEDTES